MAASTSTDMSDKIAWTVSAFTGHPRRCVPQPSGRWPYSLSNGRSVGNGDIPEIPEPIHRFVHSLVTGCLSRAVDNQGRSGAMTRRRSGLLPTETSVFPVCAPDSGHDENLRVSTNVPPETPRLRQEPDIGFESVAQILARLVE